MAQKFSPGHLLLLIGYITRSLLFHDLCVYVCLLDTTMSPTKVAEPVGNRALGEAQIPGEWAIFGGRAALWCSLSLKFFDYLFAFTSHLPSAVWTATSSDEQSQFSPTSSLVCAQMLTMWNIYCLPQTSFRTQSVYLICFTHSGNTLQSFFSSSFQRPLLIYLLTHGYCSIIARPNSV